MKPIEYNYKNFILTLYSQFGKTFLEIACTLDATMYTRVYDIKEKITKIVMDEEYVYLNFKQEIYSGKIYLVDANYQIKFEGDTGLVIDTFDNRGEHLEIIGCHDFMDEVVGV